MPRSDDSSENIASNWLLGGFGSLGCGGLLLVLGPMLGIATKSPVPMALGFLLIGAGVLMVGGSLIYGLNRHGERFTGEQTRRSGVRILNKYVYDRDNNLLMDDYLIDTADEPRFYVKIELAPGNSVEFETAREVFDSCGEGMRGEATFQGKWLSMFVGHIARPPVE